MRTRASLLLLAAVSVAAACGGGAVPAPGVSQPRALESATATAGASSGVAVPTGSAPEPGASASAIPSASSSSTASTGAVGGPKVPPPRATEQAEELAKLGLDADDLPKFEELTPTQLRGVMKLFAASLGVRCDACHQDDFAAPTPQKSVAVHMWNELVVRHALASGGGTVFCDSCHQKKLHMIDRADDAALEAAMQSSYVQGLANKDGAPMACTSCHVSNRDFSLLDRWRK